MATYGRWTTEDERKAARAKRLKFAIDYPDTILRQQGDAPGFVRANAPRAKAFADPKGPGYGGNQWPFDIEKAMREQKYRNGLRNAITSTWVDDNWKSVAKSYFIEMMADLIALELMHEEDEKQKTSQ